MLRAASDGRQAGYKAIVVHVVRLAKWVARGAEVGDGILWRLRT